MKMRIEWKKLSKMSHVYLKIGTRTKCKFSVYTLMDCNVNIKWNRIKFSISHSQIETIFTFAFNLVGNGENWEIKLLKSEKKFMCLQLKHFQIEFIFLPFI